MAEAYRVRSCAGAAGCEDGEGIGDRGSCEAVGAGGGEGRSELYVTAADGAVAGSSKEQLGADEYVTARTRLLEQMRSGCKSEEEFEAVMSREQWTEVDGQCSDLDSLHVANQLHFQRLVQQDKLNCRSSKTFDYNYRDSFFVEYGDDELVVGKKIGEGGQAEIFNASVGGTDLHVLKVLKPGYSLADLERQWTNLAGNGLYYRDTSLETCFVRSGTLLRDGRFAFLMERYWGDLRKLIDRNMEANDGLGPPFSREKEIWVIWYVARGMVCLHERGILHRDLKACNVLVNIDKVGSIYRCDVADFESSGGVQGTGFWRAPEVLKALKSGVSDAQELREVWTKKVDVYSYAMTCYEVLTGRIPFGDLACTRENYEVVIRGERPLLPEYLYPHIKELLYWCWHPNPMERPTFEHIVEVLSPRKHSHISIRKGRGFVM